MITKKEAIRDFYTMTPFKVNENKLADYTVRTKLYTESQIRLLIDSVYRKIPGQMNFGPKDDWIYTIMILSSPFLFGLALAQIIHKLILRK